MIVYCCSISKTFFPLIEFIITDKSKFLTIFTVIALFAWLLPLGAFIGASQENVACGGKRAFHMCCMMSGKVRPAGDNKISFANGASAERTAKSSAAGGDDFIAEEALRTALQDQNFTPSTDPFLYLPSLPDLSDPPPKLI